MHFSPFFSSTFLAVFWTCNDSLSLLPFWRFLFMVSFFYRLFVQKKQWKELVLEMTLPKELNPKKSSSPQAWYSRLVHLNRPLQSRLPYWRVHYCGVLLEVCCSFHPSCLFSNATNQTLFLDRESLWYSAIFRPAQTIASPHCGLEQTRIET